MAICSSYFFTIYHYEGFIYNRIALNKSEGVSYIIHFLFSKFVSIVYCKIMNIKTLLLLFVYN